MKLPNKRDFLIHTVAAMSATVISPISIFPASATSKSPTTHVVKITEFSFLPHQLQVWPGDTIIWKNLDIVPHTATAEDDSWDTGTIAKGKSVSLFVTKDMEDDYFCRFHPQMKAVLAVQRPNSD